MTGGIVMLVSSVLIGAIGWWTVIICIRALGKFMGSKNCTPPTREEIAACVHEVVREMLSKKR